MARRVAASVDLSAFTPEIGDNTSNFLLEFRKRSYNFNSVDFHAVFDDQTHSLQYTMRHGVECVVYFTSSYMRNALLLKIWHSRVMKISHDS